MCLYSKLKGWWQKRKLKPGPNEEVKDESDSKMELGPWETDYQLLVCEGLFDEYLEMGKSSIKQISAEDLFETIWQT